MPKEAIAERHCLPLVELSGLATRPTGDGIELLAIGDKDNTLVRGLWKDHTLSAVQATRPTLPGTGQWEAIATDVNGCVYLLRESPPTIVVMSAELDRTVAEFALEGGEELSGWAQEENSRGEGLLVLSNGHFLIAKEKEPPMFVEFGPATDRAQGLTLALLEDAPALQPRGTLVPLAVWAVEESIATDISDLAVYGEAVFALSDDSRVLLEFELPVPDKPLVLRTRVKLPKEVENPEGLVFIEGCPVVGIDQKKKGEPNLFVFEPQR